ncbi:conserved hypothetical protein, partial [Ixodes scapularis]
PFHHPNEKFPIMYAYVRFQDDGKKLVVSVLDVKNFKPAHTKDFNSRSWYDVWWQDDEQEGFFRAQIIKLYETQKEADDERRLKRIPIPKPPSDESDSGSSEDSRMGACQSEDVLRAYKQQQMERLFSDGDEPTDLLQAAQSEIRQLKKELMEVREQNAALQAALCSKVFQKASISTALFSLPSELDQEQGSIRPTGTCSTPRSGSLALLDAGSRVPFAPQVSGSRVRAASEVQCPAPSLWRSAPRVTPQVAPKVPLDIEELPLPARVPSPDNLFQAVHVGGNIWILSKSYDDMLRRPKDSLFVREAAVSIFSTAGLAGKSVTGTISNRTKGSPKPALDKTKFEILSSKK